MTTGLDILEEVEYPEHGECRYNTDGIDFCRAEVAGSHTLCDEHLGEARELADWLESYHRNRTPEARAEWAATHPHPILGAYHYEKSDDPRWTDWHGHATERGVITSDISDDVFYAAWTAAVEEGWLPRRGSGWNFYEEGWLEIHLRQVAKYTDYEPKPQPRGAEWTEAAVNHDWIDLREEDVTFFSDGESKSWPAMSQAELGAHLGVDRGTISRWEQGKREPSGRGSGRDYYAWLRDKAAAVCAMAKIQVLFSVMRRDGWNQVHAEEEREAREVLEARLMAAIFDPGGLYDRWKENGILPTVTPRDLDVPDELIVDAAYSIVDPSL